MGGNRRQRELAKLKYERQQARRAQKRRQARVRSMAAVATLSVVAVIVGVLFLTDLFGDDGSNAAAQGPTSAPPGICQYTSVDESGGQEIKDVGTPPVVPLPAQTVTATLHTNKGDIELELDSAKAPCTVNSFVYLAENDYFDDTRCHRLLVGAAGGVLQCGDPSATGRGSPGYEFADENLEGAAYTEGVLAMANSGPNTNGSQFFMVYSDSGFEPNYTPFGRITKGLDILTKVAEGGVTGDNNDQPKTKVVIEDVEVAQQ